MGGKGSGRKSKLEELRQAKQVLHETAPEAAQYLRDCIRGKVRRPSWIKFKICEYVLDHELGKPAQRHEIGGTGGQPLTLQALMVLALEPEVKPILIPQNGSGETEHNKETEAKERLEGG